MPDAELADRLGIAPQTVRYRRATLKVHAHPDDKKRNAKWVNWTPEMEALLGTMSDAKLGELRGITELPVSRRRRQLGIPSYRSGRGPVAVICANCGKATPRKQKAQRRSKRLFCSRTCADAGQKRRDSIALRYGPGWKNRRAEIRQRDQGCRSCGKTPEANGSALHVHHLLPFRYGGTNRPENLVALCDSCHHTIEAATDRALASIRVGVSLAGSTLTVRLADEVLWRGSALGVDSLTATG